MMLKIAVCLILASVAMIHAQTAELAELRFAADPLWAAKMRAPVPFNSGDDGLIAKACAVEFHRFNFPEKREICDDSFLLFARLYKKYYLDRKSEDAEAQATTAV